MADIHHDLLIIGTGSGNSVPDEDLGDWSIGVVESDVFGGTCLNRGCIPSKMFVYTAGVAHAAQTASKYGVRATFDGADWPAIRDRVFGRIDPLSAGGREYRSGLPNTTLYESAARFIGKREVAVGAHRITADRIVLAAGSRPAIPPVPGIHDVPHVTSDTIMRLESQPRRLIIMGGGFIGVEMGHVFDGLGTNVTIVTRSPTMLKAEDDDIRHALTDAYRDRGITVETGATTTLFETAPDAPVVLHAQTPGGHTRIEGDLLLIATGRVGNHDTLDLAAGGIEVDADGRPVVDEFQRTNVDGVWSLGDLSSDHWLKHVANAEARTVAYNIRHPEDQRPTVLPNVPSCVFGSPEVASAGARERELIANGVPYLAATQLYGDTAYGWAMEDTTSFAKILVDPESRLFLGVHVMGPYASMVAQPLFQAMALGNTVDEVAREVIYPHPALSEVVENVCLQIPDAAHDPGLADQGT